MVIEKVIIIGLLTIVAFFTVFSASYERISRHYVLHRETRFQSIFFTVVFLFLLTILIKLSF